MVPATDVMEFTKTLAVPPGRHVLRFRSDAQPYRVKYFPRPLFFRVRNFALMNYAAAAVGFAMLGLFLTLVIYLQSVLGLDALHAGLTIAPMSATSMLVAPVAGRVADRIGGKYVLVAGLSLYTIGTALVVRACTVTASRWDLLPGLVVAGVGLGSTFAPMTAVAMHDIGREMSGAASGVFATTRQLGSLLGAAAVGALLQNRLADKLAAAARTEAAGLDAAQRPGFVGGFARAGSHLRVGAGQSGTDLPAGTAPAVRDAAVRAFHDAYVNAMRPTLLLPIAVVATAALCCLAARRAAIRTPIPRAMRIASHVRH